MRWVVLGVVVVVIAVCLLLAYKSLTSPEPDIGLHEGELKPCPSKPNCVCSEPGSGAPVPTLPIAQGADVAKTLAAIASVVRAKGGEVVSQNGKYLHATFKSRLFRFIDDVEFRIDDESGEVHIRSASRAGHSDLGVNKTRVEGIASEWQKLHGKLEGG